MQQPTDESGRNFDPAQQPTTPVTDNNPARSYGPMPPLTPTPATGNTPESTSVNPTRSYGPIMSPRQPLTPAQQAATPAAQPESMEDRIVARLAAIMGKSIPADVPPAPTDLSEEDQRLVSALAGVHPAGRDVRIVKRESLVGNLFYVDYSYTPATGMRQEIHALVYDDGTNTRVFGGF